MQPGKGYLSMSCTTGLLGYLIGYLSCILFHHPLTCQCFAKLKVAATTCSWSSWHSAINEWTSVINTLWKRWGDQDPDELSKLWLRAGELMQPWGGGGGCYKDVLLELPNGSKLLPVVLTTTFSRSTICQMEQWQVKHQACISFKQGNLIWYGSWSWSHRLVVLAITNCPPSAQVRGKS